MVWNSVICPKKWIKGQIYQCYDLPPTPISYNPPVSPQSTSDLTCRDVNTSPPLSDPIPPSSSDLAWLEDSDVVPMSLKALWEIFRDFNHVDLPTNLVERLAGNKRVIQSNQDAHWKWEYHREENRILTHFAQTGTGPAIVDPIIRSVPPPNLTSPTASQKPTTPAANKVADPRLPI